MKPGELTKPVMRNDGSATYHRWEFLTDIIQREPTPGVFEHAVTFEINPGKPQSFPWLSTIARNYDQYSVESLRVHYINSAPATRQGFIYMVPDFDVSDARPQSSTEMMNQLNAVSTPVWTSVSTTINKDAMMALGPRRFLSSQVKDNDQRASDVCKIHVYNNVASSEPLNGQIWLEYKITLYAPQITSSLSPAATKSSHTDTSLSTYVYDSNSEAQVNLLNGQFYNDVNADNFVSEATGKYFMIQKPGRWNMQMKSSGSYLADGITAPASMNGSDVLQVSSNGSEWQNFTTKDWQGTTYPTGQGNTRAAQTQHTTNHFITTDRIEKLLGILVSAATPIFFRFARSLSPFIPALGNITGRTQNRLLIERA